MKILLAHGAPLSVCNIAGQTPCDVAARSNHLDIARLLESRMVLKVASVDTYVSTDISFTISYVG